MARHLAAFVHLLDDDGMAHSFGPDDTVPAWAAKKITNPDAWQDAAPQPEEPEGRPASSGRRRS